MTMGSPKNGTRKPRQARKKTAKPGHKPDGSFAKGTSGNPNGRPAGKPNTYRRGSVDELIKMFATQRGLDEHYFDPVVTILTEIDRAKFNEDRTPKKRYDKQFVCDQANRLLAYAYPMKKAIDVSYVDEDSIPVLKIAIVTDGDTGKNGNTGKSGGSHD